MIFLIAAVSQNFGIGKDNDLLFKISEDLQNFKKITLNKIIIMGRKTYESIGRKLPNRINIVVTRNSEMKSTEEDLIFANSFDDAIHLARKYKKDIGIIGGREMYKMSLEKNIIDKIYLTQIRKNAEADVFFPLHELEKFQLIFKTEEKEENGTKFYFEEYIKIK